ncbi:hypothetical protein psyc5s11_44420 [Clostridium gelidum]|uniref:Phage replisome organiser N-terminal domain-containing protein n=1 Tax=Clostridium gelidum TaxID=704125 RepID=A0ABN6J1X1_9CLOT|nr:phage replisome organizer N-terminal domain-containing protein [Clostridium gelidum]BCZ48375.1 hypothetical protein psyc5s11_44420 [Clostridium gelidum]
MRERKFVKIRVDMFEDTKFKIIDTKPERDLIHYIWTRLLTLAGKVNLEGELYLSRNIPYTIETLAIEFNRETEQVKLALNTLIDLEMIELVKDKIYRVKNFAKHQNIKIKEKVEIQDNKVETRDNTEDIINKEKIDSDCKNTNESLKNIKDYQPKSDLQLNIPISLEKKKSQKANKNISKNISCIDEDCGENKQEDITGFFEGESSMILGKDDRVIMNFCV